MKRESRRPGIRWSKARFRLEKMKTVVRPLPSAVDFAPPRTSLLATMHRQREPSQAERRDALSRQALTRRASGRLGMDQPSV